MGWSWKQLLPVDGFCVRMTHYSADTDKKVLMQLYQPLIGAQAINLYQTFYYRLARDTYQCEGSTHHELMMTTGEELTNILEARRKLEGIGLLKTYVAKRNENEDRQFTYELLPPMSPQQFFEDDVLSVFLYNRIGKQKYRQIRKQFLIPKMSGEWGEVTASFNEVFTSLHPSELIPTSEQMEERANGQMVTRAGGSGVSVEEGDFDFELLYYSLPSFFNRDQILSEQVKEAIRRLAFVYRVDPASMSQLLQQALVGDEEVDIKQLRKKVQEWYRMSFGQTPPALGLRSDQPNPPNKEKETVPEGPIDKEESAIQYYETIPPLNLLESFSDGAVVSLSDARLAESLLFDHQLPPGVANVLIDYMMRVNDRKLDAALVHKIASHWSRKKLKTVEDAMELARREHKERQQAKQPKDKRQNQTAAKQKNQTKHRSQHKERLPKWLTGEVTEVSDEEKRERANEAREKFQALLQQERKG
ncbi:replication initiation and membrane attachment protein [Geomicrobium halophilum]|uniref:Replication initiation and membrane attachment protein n=1 Tax=Geomicrobium halophilum TaxID=549000 RepID=A0A841PZN2_9BACL|nr:DnaD domain protein [Geomicrobium halophilum]MBB6448208.1 replication initiation and membrane attachment protein [Geomicrobium halophilum]